MKRITIIKLFIIVFGLLIVSCESDITKPELSGNPGSPNMADLSYNGQFSMAYADSLMSFSWAAADFGFQSSITYKLQLSPSSTFASDVVDLVTTQKLVAKVKVGDINTLILSWGNTIGTAATAYYRVSATVGSAVETIYSNSKSTTLTPYEAIIDYPVVYVPGSYQGWAPNNATIYERLFSYNFNSIYTSIIRLVDASASETLFKVTSDPDWNHTNYGVATFTPTTSGGYTGTCSTDGGAGNFTVTNGVYELTIDINALTIELTPTEDWGLIGSATPYGWNSDQNMFYNGQRKMWEITLDLVVGEFKFRANDGWTTNYGDDGSGTKTLKQDGANIAITEAGSYTIRFDPVALTYTVVKN